MAGLFDIFSNDNAEQAAKDRNTGLQQGYNALSDLYGQGRTAITQGYDKASSLYAPLVASTGAGANAYGDVSGANGVEGLQRGTDLFKNSGQYGVYGVGLNEGLQALDRTHAAAGNLASGNADTDTIRYAQDQASKAYGQFAAGLQPYLGANSNAVAGAANAATGGANAINASYQGQGAAANANYTGQGASNAAADMNNYNISQNMWNGIGKAVNLGASLFGGF
jgi:hypothetical protein